MRYLLFIALLFLLLGFSTESCFAYNDAVDVDELKIQSQHFNLMFAGSKIGNFIITKENTDGAVIYSAKSTVKVKIIRSLLFEYTLNCIFRKGVLYSSKMELLQNGEIKEYTYVEWTGNSYQVSKSDASYVINDSIFYSAVQMYFQEPKNSMTLLSEKEGALVNVEQLSPHNYMLLANENKRGVAYSYAGINLQQVRVKSFIADFILVKD